MGGRGSSSGLISGARAKKSSNSIADLEKQIGQIKSQLATMVQKHGALGLPKKYYDLQKQRQSLEGILRKAGAKNAAAKKKEVQPTSKRTFVNGFGEATTREITSASYKRAQARLDKEIESRMRGRRW